MSSSLIEKLRETGFEPVYLDKEHELFKSYVCKNSGSLCRVVVINRSQYAAEIVVLNADTRCSDFIEHFYLTNCYCCAYAFVEGICLCEWLEDAPPAQRAAVAKSIVKEIIRRRIDFQNAAYILDARNIKVTAGGNIGFDYGAPLIEARLTDVFDRLASLIRQIYGDRISPEAEAWLTGLKKMQYSSIFEAFAKMPDSCFECAPNDDAVGAEPETSNSVFYEGYWEFRRFYIKKRPILIALMIISILFGFIVGVVIPNYSGEEGNIWDSWFAAARCFNAALGRRLLRL